MRASVVSVEQALGWLSYGWQLFLKAPWPWVGVTMLYFLINVMVPMVPILGAVVMTLIAPALYAGLLFLAEDLDAGRPFELGRLFHGLADQRLRNPLLTLGGILFAVQIALVLLFMLIGLAGSFSLYALQGAESAPGVHAGIGAILAVLVALVLALAVTMAYVYATPLTAFAGVAPIDALRSSVHACLINTVPMTVVGLVLLVLAVLAAIPLFLGMLVLVPVSIGAIYASYRDLYAGSAPEGLTPGS